MTDLNLHLERVRQAPGFIAALDQSGSSTPKALKLYGVNEDQYNGETEMFDKMHAMRTRIMTNPIFTGDSIIGVIIFENTLERMVKDRPTTQYLWEVKNIIPFLKIDKGLAEEENGVQVMKPMSELDTLLEKAVSKNVFGTKMRSGIKLANAKGIEQVVQQQFRIGKQIISHDLVPIIEPEIYIHSSEKAKAEDLLLEQLMNQLNSLQNGQNVILKLTLPESANFYRPCVEHPNVVRVVALSGGYSKKEANRRLSENNGIIASFSRALTEGLSIHQSEKEFSQTLRYSIDAIVEASST